ncbi:probable serine/threonine-protein kinase vps15 [Carica papaya]|uniref:probable serine/threonine-protein kinase vps15 n=1 Tax=Carica papaya TaxID=3649 RepID=UPI000B8CBC01|nr:probable serine/threonine-protein kinase vps15 [Carica papaya]
MGNKIARTTQVSASEYYLHDLPSSYNLVLKEVLGRSRFFKSILCKHDEGLVLVKVYFKRGDFIDLREYERRLAKIKDTFFAVENPHVWPFQFWQETDKAAYLLRQYFFNNLHDRLSTRPFLSLVEKKWLAFQLLLAVKQCHEQNICHGDIKCENVLVTSWNWLYLADFASFKPTYIPYDDPSDFSFFFDTGGRRLCYLAPERFYEHGGEMQVAQDAPLKPSMDIFAVGCVIAELFLEGQPLFELSQLLAYRRGQYDPSQHLEKANFSFSPFSILYFMLHVPDDPEESVRICYASNIAKLALTAYGFLIHSIHLSKAGVLDELSLPRESLASSNGKNGQLQRLNGDAQLAQLRKSIAEVVQELVMGPKQTPNIRRALLQDIGNLCCFFGQRQSNDFLLPILPAFLNDRDEQLRAVFFEKIVYVCFFVGQRSVEEYLLPYIEQALSDITEAVIANALDCLAILCTSGFLRKRILLEMIERAFPLLCYPSQWVRRSAVTFIAASSESLGAVDSYVFLAPVIRPFLRRQPASLASEKTLFSCLKPPVSRQVFYQVLENVRSSDMLERQRKIWYNSSAQSKQWETMDLLKKEPGELSSATSWSDKQPSLEDRGPPGSALEQDLTESGENTNKLRPMGSLICKASTALDLNDPLCSEKLQFSCFMSPQVTGVNSLLCDKSSEGIPLYSFSLDKRTVGIPPVASESSLLMNSLGIGSLSMPWMDPLNKSFSLASSVPAPKLISGSFTVGTGSKQFHRVVHEPDGREGEMASINGKFQDMAVSGTIRGNSVTGEDISAPIELTGVPSFARTLSVPDSGWRPRGVLVAHLQEHRSSVNDIAVSNDHSFFVSASDDSTVKVWDSRKLEKDISFRSRLTYHLEGSRALCATMLRNSAQVVIGACDGMIHTFSVDYISKGLGNIVEKYSGIADIKKKDIGEGAILTLLNYPTENCSSQMVMYSTQNCGIHLWDIRSNSDAWKLQAVPEEGYVSSLVIGPCGNWFVSGSSRGVLTLWDMRFLVPVKSWQYSIVCPIEKMCLFVPSLNGTISTVARPLIFVAAGCNEVSLWNAENGSCHQVLRVANYENDAEISDLPWSLARPSGKSSSKADLRRNINSRYRVDELNEPPSRLPGIRSLLPLPGGDLLTGGTDLKIRRWDHYSPEKSYCLCGPNLKGVGNDDFYETRSNFGVQVVQETKRRPLTTKLSAKAVLAAAVTDSAGCHRDSILSLASVKLNQRLLISSSRDGAIKVWK